MGQIVEFPVNGHTGKAYLARSKKEKGPGVIVLQEWWGLVDHIKDVCDRFAEAGFTALAPDLFHGETTKEPSQAERMFMQLNIEEAEKNLRFSISRLLEDEACDSSRVGVVGFCMGGQLALLAAANNPDQIAAVADFYGVHPNVKPNLSQIQAPVLGIFAEKDPFVPPQSARELENQLKTFGKETDFYIFSDVDHAFFNDSRPDVYNESAAREAWQKTLSHFEKHLS